jgi:hypothetical protein
VPGVIIGQFGVVISAHEPGELAGDPGHRDAGYLAVTQHLAELGVARAVQDRAMVPAPRSLCRRARPTPTLGGVPVVPGGLHQRGADPLRAGLGDVAAPGDLSIGVLRGHQPGKHVNERAFRNRRESTTSLASVSAVNSPTPR